MTPAAWVAAHPVLLAVLLGLAFVAGAVTLALVLLGVVPETDELRSSLNTRGRA